MERELICATIDGRETGWNIRRLMDERNITVRDVQQVMGFEYPTSVYNWIEGKKLPSYDNFIILCSLLETTIDEIIVVESKDAAFWRGWFAAHSRTHDALEDQPAEPAGPVHNIAEAAQGDFSFSTRSSFRERLVLYQKSIQLIRSAPSPDLDRTA